MRKPIHKKEQPERKRNFVPAGRQYMTDYELDLLAGLQHGWVIKNPRLNPTYKDGDPIHKYWDGPFDEMVGF